MISTRRNIFTSILLFALVSLAAWPAYVAANLGFSYLLGEGSVVDLWANEPKRNLIVSFLAGYKSSAVLAGLAGLVAVIDFQLFHRYRATRFLGGILLPIFFIALAFLYIAEPIPVLGYFATAGAVLWVLYKFVSYGCRLGSNS